MSAEIALLQLVLTPQNGATWFEGSVQGLIQMTSSPRFRASGGNPSLLQQWRALSSGVLGRRGFPLESCAARICREAGARVSTNIRVQDLDLLPGGQLDDRRLEVVADGLPLFHGAQLAIDTTLVSPVRADGAPRRQCATRDGAALDQARRTKERRYPELTGEYGRARLVVLACETGGRWSEEAHDFLRHLARARARSEPPEIRAVARRSWFRRWCTALSCCAAQAFAL